MNEVSSSVTRQQFTKRSSLDILEAFLATRGCQLDPKPYLDGIPTFSIDYADLPGDIIEKIIRDSYDDANPVVKRIAEKLASDFKVLIGRVHKNQLKKYIDYGRRDDLVTFIQLIGECEIDARVIESACNEIILSEATVLKRSQTTFWQNLNDAIANKNSDRVKDYLVFLYSRLLAFNENRRISLRFLFEQERDLIRKELLVPAGNGTFKDGYQELEMFCNNHSIDDHATIVSNFNKKYLDILETKDGSRDKKALVYLNLDQELFDAKGTRKDFFDFLFAGIKKSHEILRNHHVLVIKVENILSAGLNLKWDIYAQATVFAEKNIPTRFNRTYYRAEEICADVIEHKIAEKLSVEDYEHLKQYYSENLQDRTGLEGILSRPEILDVIEFFKQPLSGYSFIDCYILQHDRTFENSAEINFVENKNELLLIYYKNVVDERKIPCPICGSLKISGNSYTEIGEKSWECKNPLCAERSKTNRGKRYSMRTIFMQDSLYDFRQENLVPKSLIKVWRKDLVERSTDEQLSAMIIKYYTHPGDTVLAINLHDQSNLMAIASREKRNVEVRSFDVFVPEIEQAKDAWTSFLDGQLFSQFIYEDPKQRGATKATSTIPLNLVKKNPICIIQDDCIDVMRKIEKNSIHAMITSPPYYNAREYSQWANLYNYLHDMYCMIALAKDILVPGGVFFYNIGDIYDNERTIVKSTMGNKRIPLGAYIILLFQKAGFTLLDNIAWYKGEPQSNRQKNDGNFVPFYQRPTNCYEHMFVFKTPGNLNLTRDMSQNTLHSNVQKFSPVIKIGKGGINKYGHSAPFPPELPLLAISCFTNYGNLVLDPYSGSGTTAITAASCGRIGIGTEMNREYALLSVGMARERNLKVTLLKQSDNDVFTKEDVIAAGDAVQARKQATLDAFGERDTHR